MSDQNPTSLATEDEITAALAEAERQAAGIPSLDDGSDENVVHVPVETGPPRRPQPPPKPDDSPASRVVAVPRPAADPPETAAAVAAEPVADDSLDEESDDEPINRPPILSRLTRFVWLVYDGMDLALWAINRPFEWMKPETRQLTGMLGIVTIATSLLALYLLPILAPPRDAITILKEQALEAQAVLEGAVAPDDDADDDPEPER
jgi:hypothetical protein